MGLGPRTVPPLAGLGLRRALFARLRWEIVVHLPASSPSQWITYSSVLCGMQGLDSGWKLDADDASTLGLQPRQSSGRATGVGVILRSDMACFRFYEALLVRGYS